MPPVVVLAMRRSIAEGERWCAATVQALAVPGGDPADLRYSPSYPPIAQGDAEASMRRLVAEREPCCAAAVQALAVPGVVAL